MKRFGRRRRRRRIPKLPIAIAVIAAACAIAFLVWRLHGRGDGDSWETGTRIVAAGSEIPTVSFGYSDEYIDPQHGYLTPLDVSVTHGSLVPLTDRQVRVRIEPWGCEILGASYELLTLDGTGLVAQEDGLTPTERADGVYLEAELPTVVRDGVEYMLRLTLRTSKQDAVYYYTRVRISTDLYLDEILRFTRGFSDATFDKQSGRDRILAYLESDITVADNTNLGYVDLKSYYGQITWGGLAPQRPESVRTTIRDVWHFDDGSCAAAVTYDYEVTAADENGRDRLYAVTEYYLMRQYDTVTGYLLDYYRTVDDITPLTAEDVSEGTVSLGILSPDSLPPEAAAAGEYAVFEEGGRLWEYVPGRRGKLILLFDSADSENGCPPAREKGYQIVSLDADSGEVTFMVYGYMDNGPRQGCCGMGLYRYDRRADRLTELFFVESARPYEVIREEVGRLSCMGADGSYYFYYDNGIYAIGPGESEPAVIAQGLGFGSFAVSSDGTRAAWAEGRGTAGYLTVRLMDLENGLTFRAAAAEDGEELLIEGFTGHDVVIGRLHTEDAGTDADGRAVVPMYELTVLSEITSVANRNVPGQEREEDADAETESGGETEEQIEAIDLEEVTSYRREGVYIRRADTDDTHVTIWLLRRDGTEYLDAGEDTLLRTGEDSAEEAGSLLVRTTAEVRETVWELRLFDPSDAAGTVTLTSAGEAELTETGVSTLAGQSGSGSVWLAYARGRLVGFYGSLNEAQEEVYPYFGLVTDRSGERVWSRLSANAEAAASAGEEETGEAANETGETVPEDAGDAGGDEA